MRTSAAPRVDMIFFDAGGGHRAAAMALAAAAHKRGCGWQANPVNLRNLLGPVDFVRNSIGVRFEDIYNGLLKRGMTLGTGAMLRFSQLLIALWHEREVAALARHWRASPTDLVMSLIPNFNRAIFQGLRAAATRSSAPMVTVLTDFADYPPHFWIEPQEQYFVCGSALAVEQAVEMGHPRARIFRASGMVVRPEFYEPSPLNREYERRRLGLSAELPTGLVMFGGFGSRRMIAIARRIGKARLKTQVIFLCGHNRRIQAQLSAMRFPFPCRIEGFTPRPDYFMRLSDYFVGKPGPGSLSEAWVMGLPVIVERNARTMVQERYNTELIRQEGLGIVLPSFSGIAAAIQQMIDPDQLAEFRERVRARENRALFEIPSIVDALIESHRRGAGVRADPAAMPAPPEPI